ncbi:MAG: nuclear transport factor 2 family protein [Candidatus Heimdallarchaeota archaeon]|nr:nuclear transport factor 2 family protein [Candidatus Heimdallarchaeota archaeon]
MDEIQEIIDIVNNQFENYISQNVTSLKENFQYFSMHHKGIGTGENEIFNTLDELMNTYLSTSDTLIMELMNTEFVQAEINGHVAWVLVIFTIKQMDEGLEIIRKVRFSGVFIKESGNWKYTQTHWSTPEIGLESGKGKPTMIGLRKKINELLHEFSFVSSLDSKRSELQEYLEKTKEIADVLES